jgi:YHS domain-containing protein
MAADASMLPLLLGLGVSDISVAIGVGSGLRRELSRLDTEWCKELARHCREADSLADVRALLGRTSKAASGGPTVGQGEALDPVCGMVVSIDDTPYVLRIGGVAHYFCSASCLRHFVAESNPGRRM